MHPLIVAVLALTLSACASGPARDATPSPGTTPPTSPPSTPALVATIAAAVAATQTAIVTASVVEPSPTAPPGPTTTPLPPPPTTLLSPAAPPSSATPPSPATLTPAPAATRTPAPRPATVTPLPPTPPPATPAAPFQPVSQTLWLPASSAGEATTVEIILTNARVWPGDQYQRPEPDHVFLIVDVEVRNQGPASLRGVNGFDFIMLDDDRAVHQPRLLRPTNDCPPRLVELLPGGRLRACFGYQVLARGPVEFIYAPRRATGLRPGTYLSFPLRQA